LVRKTSYQSWNTDGGFGRRYARKWFCGARKAPTGRFAATVTFLDAMVKQ
jgi:hypothetical protein